MRCAQCLGPDRPVSFQLGLCGVASPVWVGISRGEQCGEGYTKLKQTLKLFLNYNLGSKVAKQVIQFKEEQLNIPESSQLEENITRPKTKLNFFFVKLTLYGR